MLKECIDLIDCLEEEFPQKVQQEYDDFINRGRKIIKEVAQRYQVQVYWAPRKCRVEVSHVGIVAQRARIEIIQALCEEAAYTIAELELFQIISTTKGPPRDGNQIAKLNR